MLEGSIVTIGEILVEIMATTRGHGFREAQTLIGPLVSAVGFSILTELLRLQFPYAYLMLLGALLILLVLYLPGGLASLLPRFRRTNG